MTKANKELLGRLRKAGLDTGTHELMRDLLGRKRELGASRGLLLRVFVMSLRASIVKGAVLFGEREIGREAFAPTDACIRILCEELGDPDADRGRYTIEQRTRGRHVLTMKGAEGISAATTFDIPPPLLAFVRGVCG